jgi:hypothetical protein
VLFAGARSALMRSTLVARFGLTTIHPFPSTARVVASPGLKFENLSPLPLPPLRFLSSAIPATGRSTRAQRAFFCFFGLIVIFGRLCQLLCPRTGVCKDSSTKNEDVHEELVSGVRGFFYRGFSIADEKTQTGSRAGGLPSVPVTRIVVHIVVDQHFREGDPRAFGSAGASPSQRGKNRWPETLFSGLFQFCVDHSLSTPAAIQSAAAHRNCALILFWRIDGQSA